MDTDIELAATEPLNRNGHDVDIPNGVNNTDNDKEDGVSREVWARKAEYLLSLVGYTVGLGVVWRFPYLCIRNGGGAFLIPFFICMFVCGFPLYYMELCLGQFSAKSPLVVWCICPLFRGLGFCMTMLSFIVTWYYGVVIAWILCYLFYSFYPTQPWASCDNAWNSDNCVVLRSGHHPVNQWSNLTITNQTRPRNLYNNTDNVTSNTSELFFTSASEFWRFQVTGMSAGLDDVGTPQWHLVLATFLSNALTFVCIVKGIRSVGKVAYVTALLPYLLLTVLLVQSLTLQGSMDGIIYYLTPDFSKILTAKVWFEASLQVFYSLGPAWGGVLTMASYSKYHNKCFGDAVLCTTADCFSNFFCGFVVFSILGFLAHESGLDITEVAESGPGLVFQAYPEALSRLPMPNLWAVLFFIMLLAVGLDSQFGMLETVLGGLRDMYPSTFGGRKHLLLVGVFLFYFGTGLIFTTSAGVYIFTLVDWYSSAYCIFLTAFCECLVVGWVYGAERMSRDIETMTGRQLSWMFRLSWCVITPLSTCLALLGSLLVYEAPSYKGYMFPAYTEYIGILIGLVSVIPLPILAVKGYLQASGSPSQKIADLTTPDKKWVPSDRVVRETYKVYHYNSGFWSRFKANLFGRT